VDPNNAVFDRILTKTRKLRPWFLHFAEMGCFSWLPAASIFRNSLLAMHGRCGGRFWMSEMPKVLDAKAVGCFECT